MAWFITWNLSPKRTNHLAQKTTTAILALLLLIAIFIALPHRSLPTLPTQNHTHLIILGDSISAGIDSSNPWPARFQQLTGVSTTNLSRPGIGTLEALDLAKKIIPADSLILLEIGGNDLLSDLPATDFQRQLSKLLTLLDQPHRTLIMFELPLFPHKIAYGKIQRQLAKEHHVTLIPKRFFIQLLSNADATSDGLHLSPTGAQNMAAFIADFLCPTLQTPPSARRPPLRAARARVHPHPDHTAPRQRISLTS